MFDLLTLGFVPEAEAEQHRFAVTKVRRDFPQSIIEVFRSCAKRERVIRLGESKVWLSISIRLVEFFLL